MKEYIENILHRKVQIIPYEDVQKLPLAYRSDYIFYIMTIETQDALVAEPKEKISLALLRKQQRQMVIYTGLPCVLYLRDMNYYTRDAFLDEGIPFVWEGHQIYLPFVGTLLNDYPGREITACAKISYLTQKLLLTALYQGWQMVTVTKAAQILGVSKMSITRCFDELEAMEIPCLTVRSRARSITADADKKAMWERIRGVLRNPVITTYALRKEPDIVLPMSGTMALAHYSMIDEGPYPVLAMTKKELADLSITAEKQALAGEIPGCVIQELGYEILFESGKVIDPLTTALTISEEERIDPRISMAIDEMMEEHVWSKELNGSGIISENSQISMC